MPEDPRKNSSSDQSVPQVPTVDSVLLKIKSGLDNLALEVEVKSLKISQELIEPLDVLNREYYGDVQVQIQGAQNIYIHYMDLNNKLQDSKENYFGLKEEAERCDMRIEEAMLALD